MQNDKQPSTIDKIIRFCLENKLVVFMIIIFVLLWGVLVAPFDWNIKNLPRDPVPVDAIPDIGENQQIVFTEWMGRSPQDVEDQIGYPLTVSLLGIPGVKSIRSYSFFGFSSIFIIFQEFQILNRRGEKQRLMIKRLQQFTDIFANNWLIIDNMENHTPIYRMA